MHAHKKSVLHDLVCPYWLAFSLESPLRRLIQKPEAILAGLVTPGQTALDLGCGPGYYTLALADLVGPSGRVIAVDIQPAMLGRVRTRAEKAGLLKRITLHQALPDRIGVAGPVDFALAMWMVHEVPDAASFLGEVHGIVRPGGSFLIVEPKLHVVMAKFDQTLRAAEAAGFEVVATPQVGFSRAVLLQSGRGETHG
jgi:ubiquinone/menaquinone biosynthesis C-methylase UbiE